MARIVIGLSGGVDSSVAAYLLKQQGHEVIGLFMINWHDTTGTLEGDCPWHDDRVFAELVAKRLDIELHTVDLSADYRTRVVDYMFEEYGRGRTPNPDVLCNREIKFDVFLREALRLGAEFVATGHYCRKAVETAPDGSEVYRLLAGADPDKDQSYFLCQLSQEQLRYALFPVGDLLKPEVRRIAAEQQLATARRKDSQGICFVGKVDLPVFLQQQLAARQGPVHEILPTWPGYGQNADWENSSACDSACAGGTAGVSADTASPAIPATDIELAARPEYAPQAGNEAPSACDSACAGGMAGVSADTASPAIPVTDGTPAGPSDDEPAALPRYAPQAGNEAPSACDSACAGGTAAVSADTVSPAIPATDGYPAGPSDDELAALPKYAPQAGNEAPSACDSACTGGTAAVSADTVSLAIPATDGYAAGPSDDELAALAAPWRYTVRDGKKIGEHHGAHFYTIGQRKGLGIGGRKDSLFVLATDVGQNVVYVGEGDAHSGLWRRALRMAPSEVHWVDPLRRLAVGDSARFRVRIRYRQPLQDATLHVRARGAFLVFDTPQRGIAPGQFAAWYDGDELVGSGVISE